MEEQLNKLDDDTLNYRINSLKEIFGEEIFYSLPNEYVKQLLLINPND